MAQLSEYAAGELEGEDAERVAAHVEGCLSCRRMVEGLRLIGPALREVGAAGRRVEEVDHTFALARAGARAVRDGGAAGLPEELGGGPGLLRRFGTPIAVAAATVLALGVGLQLGGSGQTVEVSETSPLLIEKGGGDDLPSIHLSFSVQSIDGVISRGLDGWRYKPTDLLYFRCSLLRSGYLVLARAGKDGLEQLYPFGPERDAKFVGPGDWDLSDGTHLLSYSIETQRGPQRFLAIYSPVPFTLTPQLRAELVSGADPAVLRSRQLVVDEVRLEVGNH